MSRLCASVQMHYGLSEVPIAIAPIPYEKLQSPFGAYLHDVSFWDHTPEFIIGVDTSIVPPAMVLGGIAHEMGHIAIDSARTLQQLDLAAQLYGKDRSYHRDEEVLANALAIDAGFEREIWRMARWSRDEFGVYEPLAAVRDAYDLLG